LGVGKVWNVQQDGKVQVILLASAPTAAAALDAIRRNDKDTIDRLYIKPTVPHDDLLRLQGPSDDDTQ
jgi:hypothetical protein